MTGDRGARQWEESKDEGDPDAYGDRQRGKRITIWWNSSSNSACILKFFLTILEPSYDARTPALHAILTYKFVALECPHMSSTSLFVQSARPAASSHRIAFKRGTHSCIKYTHYERKFTQ